MADELDFRSTDDPNADYLDEIEEGEHCYHPTRGSDTGDWDDDFDDDADCVHCECCCTCLGCEYGPRDGQLMSAYPPEQPATDQAQQRR